MENIYEPAAHIADSCAALTTNETRKHEARYIAAQIRALPNPPSELPVFTAQELAAEMKKYNPDNPDGPFRSEIVRDYVNARLAAFRPAPASELPGFTGKDLRREFERSGERGGLNAWDYLARYINNCLSDLAIFRPALESEPDLERMQEALDRASREVKPNDIWFAVSASAIAAEGFRLGDAPKSTYGEGYQKGYNDCRKDYEGIDDGIVPSSIKDRICAAVLAERQTCAEAVTRMRVPPELASQFTLLQIAIGILKREENSDDAGDGEHCGSSPSLTASLPVAEGGAGREQSPLTYGQVRQQIEAEHPDDPNHYGVAATARRIAEAKAFDPWVRWAEAISGAVCSSASVPMHCKHEVEAALNVLPVVRQGEKT